MSNKDLSTNQLEKTDICVTDVSIKHKRHQVMNGSWYITPPVRPDDGHNHPGWLFYIRECTTQF